MRLSSLFHRHLSVAFAAVAAIAVIGSTDASAQRFQYVYGGPDCREAGRWGVTQLSNGDYLAVGETFSVTAPCDESDIYVVRTASNGARVWSFAYHIGRQDSALDVIEDQEGNFVICGVTENDVCLASRDAFLLKIDPNGNVISARIYGRKESDEIAYNLVEARFGDGGTTNPGDYIVVGSTTFEAGEIRDGLIFRTDPNLNLIWDNRYHGERDEFFYGVTEAQIERPDCRVGDVVAVGGTNTWGVGGYDVFIARVDGNNGNPVAIATWGHEKDEEGWAIIEVRNYDVYASDLVITGFSYSRNPQVAPEVLMLQTTCNPCNIVADQYAGDAGDLPDAGIDLKEDDFPYDASLPDVIVTGYTSFGGDKVIGENVFLQRFALGSMNLTGNAMAYGGDGNDWGWSVNNAHDLTGAETDGYIVTGFNASPNLIVNDPQQLYLIKTDVNLSSGCNEWKFEFTAEKANLEGQCIDLHFERFLEECEPPVEQIEVDWEKQLCYFFPKLNPGTGESIAAPSVISLNEGTVTSYPNPVTSGTSLNLRFDLTSEASVEIIVSDITGRVMHRTSTQLEAASNLRTIETEGWAAGTYLVRVTIGDRSATARVVVLEK